MIRSQTLTTMAGPPSRGPYREAEEAVGGDRDGEELDAVVLEETTHVPDDVVVEAEHFAGPLRSMLTEGSRPSRALTPCNASPMRSTSPSRSSSPRFAN